MSALDELREVARNRRDELFKQARDEYRETMHELNAMARKLGKPLPRKPRVKTIPKLRGHQSDFSKMTVKRAAELVLEDSGPLPLIELTLEVQRRGCRATDDPHAVMHAIRSAFSYHKGLFSRDGAGRWVVGSDP